MGRTIAFRPAEPADQEFLYRVYASTRTEELAIVPWDDAQKEAFLRMQFNAQHTYYHAEYPDAAYQVILADGEPIGRLYVHRPPNEISIIDIALLPEHRRAGIGRSLLTDLLAEGKATGKPVRIHVEKENPALNLYERLGFTKIGDTGVYWYMECIAHETK